MESLYISSDEENCSYMSNSIDENIYQNRPFNIKDGEESIYFASPSTALTLPQNGKRGDDELMVLESNESFGPYESAKVGKSFSSNSLSFNDSSSEGSDIMSELECFEYLAEWEGTGKRCAFDTEFESDSYLPENKRSFAFQISRENSSSHVVGVEDHLNRTENPVVLFKESLYHTILNSYENDVLWQSNWGTLYSKTVIIIALEQTGIFDKYRLDLISKVIMESDDSPFWTLNQESLPDWRLYCDLSFIYKVFSLFLKWNSVLSICTEHAAAGSAAITDSSSTAASKRDSHALSGSQILQFYGDELPFPNLFQSIFKNQNYVKFGEFLRWILQNAIIDRFICIGDAEERFIFFNTFINNSSIKNLLKAFSFSPSNEMDMNSFRKILFKINNSLLQWNSLPISSQTFDFFISSEHLDGFYRGFFYELFSHLQHYQSHISPFETFFYISYQFERHLDFETFQNGSAVLNFLPFLTESTDFISKKI